MAQRATVDGWLGSVTVARYGLRGMRLPAILVLLVTACSNGGGASVTLAIPASTKQSLTGFDAGGRAVLSLAVVCDDGRGGTYEQELSTRVESAGFFVPACGPATLNLTIIAEYGSQDPVVAFEATNTAILESGVNADVEFTGVAYGELILDPLGQPILSCTYEDSGGLYGLRTVAMDGSVFTFRVPAAAYDVYCFDAVNPLPTTNRHVSELVSVPGRTSPLTLTAPRHRRRQSSTT